MTKPTSQRFCTCGHDRLSHRHSLTTPQTSWKDFERSFSQCAIQGCPCVRFVEEKYPKRDPSRKAEPSVSQKLFDLPGE